MQEFGLKAGPQIGKILANIQEEQAAGTILNKETALEYAARLINEQEGKQHGY